MAQHYSRKTLQVLAVGLVCIAAISIGAATITATVDLESDRPILGDGPQDRVGNSGEPVDNGNGDFSSEGGAAYFYDLELTRCNEPLASMPGTVLYFAAVAGLLVGIRRRYSGGAAVMGGFAIAPFAVTGYFLMTACASLDGGGTGIPGPGDGNPGADIVTVPEVSPVVLVGLVGVLLVAAAVVVVRASGDQVLDLDDEDESAFDDEVDVADLAAAAGAAADRLERFNVDVDNAVYRAWWEMTRLLDVENPASATPGEFAQAAIAAGMTAEHVNDLTTLFVEVRYGERDAATREERAIEVFRSIEAAYGVDDETRLDVDSFETVDDEDGDAEGSDDR